MPVSYTHLDVYKRQSPGCTAMQAIGYKELAAAVTGQGDLQAALEQVKLRSRQYAKRQLTWFRRDRSIQWRCV